VNPEAAATLYCSTAKPFGIARIVCSLSALNNRLTHFSVQIGHLQWLRSDGAVF